MCRPVGAEATGFGQGPGIAPVGLHPPLPLAGHRRVVRVGDDDLMTQLFETACHPLALGPRLEQDAGSGIRLQHGGEAIAFRADAPLDDLAVFLEHAHLAHPSSEVYANMVHGWSSFAAPLSATDRCGASL